ncbi:hypothetical protein [Mesorhizobium qingshengii]|uniref:hypothetical protein n=1 Tax=Mesorhizobium qingshengii TaxID=1165689 RepID=UPI00115F9316|nr:hypothetical protein [Mesorhizobium qingshengii]
MPVDLEQADVPCGFVIFFGLGGRFGITTTDDNGIFCDDPVNQRRWMGIWILYRALLQERLLRTARKLLRRSWCRRQFGIEPLARPTGHSMTRTGNFGAPVAGFEAWRVRRYGQLRRRI